MVFKKIKVFLEEQNATKLTILCLFIVAVIILVKLPNKDMKDVIFKLTDSANGIKKGIKRTLYTIAGAIDDTDNKDDKDVEENYG